MIASLVGMLTIVQPSGCSAASRRIRAHAGWLSLGAVLMQGLLGGITVLLLLPKPSPSRTPRWRRSSSASRLHRLLHLALVPQLRTMEKGDAPLSLAWSVTAIVYLQILAGAILRISAPPGHP